MNLKSTTAILLVIAACGSSCASNEQLQKRMDRRNDRYSTLSERREIRTDARQKRTDEWFDRQMH